MLVNPFVLKLTPTRKVEAFKFAELRKAKPDK
jgi:hypothetical protein